MLVHNWKKVITGSWSARAAMLLGVLHCVQSVLPQVAAIVPPQTTATLTVGLALAIPVLRVIKQKGL